MPIEWREAMAIGSKTIDEDHKQLIATINEFESCPDFTHAEAAARKLFRYTQEHFQREENLQALMRYPLVDMHREAHQLIINNLKEVIRSHFLVKTDAEGQRQAIDKLSALMRDWIVGHVLRVDVQMKPYLPKKG